MNDQDKNKLLQAHTAVHRALLALGVAQDRIGELQDQVVIEQYLRVYLHSAYTNAQAVDERLYQMLAGAVQPKDDIE